MSDHTKEAKLPRPGVITDAQRIEWLERHGEVAATTGWKPSDGIVSHFEWAKLGKDGSPTGQSLRDAIDAMMRGR